MANQNFSFALKQIDILGFDYILSPGYSSDHEFTIDFTTQHFINKTGAKKYSSLIAVVVTIFEEPEKKTKLAKIGVQYSFEIITDSITQKKDNYYIPKVFYYGPTNIAIGTTRGIMFSKFYGTYLELIYLPLFFPDKILEQITENKLVRIKATEKSQISKVQSKARKQKVQSGPKRKS